MRPKRRARDRVDLSMSHRKDHSPVNSRRRRPRCRAIAFATAALAFAAGLGGCLYWGAGPRAEPESEATEPGASPETAKATEAAAEPDWIEGDVPETEPVDLTPLTPERKRSLMRRALERIRAGRYEQAEADLWRLARTYEEIADYVDYYRIRALAGRGARDDALSFARVFRFRHPESLVVGEVLGLQARLVAEQGTGTDVIRVVDRALATDAVDGPEALLLLKAEAIEREGDLAGALALYRDIRKRYPRSASGRAARARVDYLEGAHPELRPERDRDWLLSEVRTLRAEGRWNAALGVYDELARQSAGRADLAGILAARAEMLGRMGAKSRAIAQYEEVVRRWPSTKWARDALYAIARAHWNEDRDVEALKRLRTIVRDYARFGAMDDVWYMAGRIHLTAGRERDAIANLTRLAERGTGDRAVEGAWLLGWLHYQRGRWREARAAFGELARAGEGGPSTPKGLYWKAVAALRTGDAETGYGELERLGTRYAGTYYAHLARLRLAERRRLGPEAFSVAEGADAIHPEIAHFLEYMDRPELLERAEWLPRIRAAEELHAVGLEDWASREIRVIERANGGDLRVRFQVARLYSEAGSYLAAVRVANGIEWDLRRKGVGSMPRPILELQYPLAYWETITTVADSWRIDPFLVAALIRQESVFNPEARSHANAMGLMQILPKTGRQVAQDLGRWPFRSDLLFVPDINIALGVPYLAQLLEKTGGSHVRALAAYNAGEKALAKWVSRSGELPDDEFIETISYPETNGYVKLILRNRYNYEAIYAEEARMRSAMAQPIRVVLD